MIIKLVNHLIQGKDWIEQGVIAWGQSFIEWEEKAIQVRIWVNYCR